MSSLIERVRAQGGRGEVRTIEVPEWGEGGKPLVIRYLPPNLNHTAAALDAHPKNPIRQNLDVLCQIAMGEDDKPLFRRIDANDLMEWADPRVLGRVMRQMGIVGDGADEAAQEKN